jgi:uncharacterized protein with GYD domain
VAVATFISLVNWTDQGIKDFGASADRSDAANALMGKHGGKLTHVWWTVGPYDLVVVSEFPDEQSGTAALLELGALGNVRTTTLPAFDADQFRAIVAKTG